MRRIVPILSIVFVTFLSGCFGGNDLITRKGESELIPRWENNIQPGKEVIEVEGAQISKVTGDYSLEGDTTGEYDLLEETDKSGGYLARAKVYNTGQVNAMPYELTWDARTGMPLSSNTTSPVVLEDPVDDYADMFFVGDDYVRDDQVAVFFVGDSK